MEKALNRYGLTKKAMDFIQNLFSSYYPKIEKVYLFGSRFSGNFRSGSDVDLAIESDHITTSDFLAIKYQLMEFFPIPLKFDIVLLGRLKNENFKQEIQNKSEVIYERDPL